MKQNIMSTGSGYLQSRAIIKQNTDGHKSATHSPTSKLVGGNYSVPRVRYSIQSTVSAVNYRVFSMVKVN